MAKNILFSFKKVKKHTILAGQGGQEPPLALPCGRLWAHKEKWGLRMSKMSKKLGLTQLQAEGNRAFKLFWVPQTLLRDP